MNANTTQLKMFWDYIKPKTKEEYVEIRITPFGTPTIENKRQFYKNLLQLKIELPNTKNNKYICWFCQTFDEVKTILTINNGFFNTHKLCYGVNKRFYNKKTQHIDGSYESLRYVDLLCFDLEKTDHSDITSDFEQSLFENYVKYVIHVLQRDNLFNPTIINSGVGKHLLYKIAPQKITDGKKLWYKQYIDDVNITLTNDNFTVDGLKDFTRILGLPGSMNPKRKKLTMIQTLSYHVNDFKIKSRRLCALSVQQQTFKGTKDEAIQNILQDPLVKLLLRQQLPEGNRNSHLIFPLKILLIQHGFVERDTFVQSLFTKITHVQKERFPSNFPKTIRTQFNKNVVNKYCRINNIKEVY